MKNYLKTIIVCCVVGALTMAGTSTLAQNVSGNLTYVLPNATISVDRTIGIDLDFSRLSPGTHAFIEMFDAKGSPYTFKVERKENLKLAVYADTSTLSGLEANTTINFKGKGKLIKSVNLTELNNQRCGLICFMINICCVHVHLGPPANTWEWSCSNCTGGIE